MNKAQKPIAPLEVVSNSWLHTGKLLFLLVLLSVSFLAACSRPPELIGVENPENPIASAESAKKRKIFITTTRQPSDVEGALYSSKRSDKLGFASVIVSIPPQHKVGKIERPSSLPPDPERDFGIVEPRIHGGANEFVAAIDKELTRRPTNQRNILLFVHGYNTTTSDAVLRLTQFVEDSQYSGIPVLFTWASAGKTTHYVYDLNSALAARQSLLEAIHWLTKTKARKFDAFAHSMGSMLTVEAVVQAELAGKFNRTGHLSNVMLAAPDIDYDVFQRQLALIAPANRNIFVFVSSDDKALGFSRRVSGGVVRVGAADAASLSATGVTVIDLSEVDDSADGSHSKFAGSPEVVQLIGRGLQVDHFNRPRAQPTLGEVLDGVPILSGFGN